MDDGEQILGFKAYVHSTTIKLVGFQLKQLVSEFKPKPAPYEVVQNSKFTGTKSGNEFKDPAKPRVEIRIKRLETWWKDGRLVAVRSVLRYIG